jgi:Holliday junction resolvase RusA-like endonuclease
MIIELPWPPSSLSGHNKGSHWSKSPIVANHRLVAYLETKRVLIEVENDGDILVSVKFHAPNNRSDRMNYWNRCKPYFDGIADALGVNDKRFKPAGYNIGENVKNGRVVVVLS